MIMLFKMEKDYIYATIHHDSDERKLYDKKIVSIDFLKKLKNKKIIFTKGVFDIVHSGHLRLFGYCKKLKELNKNSLIVVGVSKDSIVKKTKGNLRPINPELERARLISSIDYIDLVVLFNERYPKNIIKNTKPTYYIKGQDTANIKNEKGRRVKIYSSEKNPEVKLLNKYGGKMIVLCDDSSVSTTKIIKRILRRFRNKYVK